MVSRRADDDKSACVDNVRIASVVVVLVVVVLVFGFFAGGAPVSRVLFLSLLTVILRDSASATACARVFAALRMHGLHSLR
jgi:hypothetical protein